MHAEELAHFAQTIEMESRSGRAFGREVVARVEQSAFRKETRTCYGCEKSGHVKADCRSKKAASTNGGRRAKGSGNIVLAVGEGTSAKGLHFDKSNQKPIIEEDSDRDGDGWILDSGSSRHLVNDPDLLQDAKMCDHECHLEDGELINLLRAGNVVLTVVAGEQHREVTLTEVYLAPGLSRNIISYGKLEQKGFCLAYDGSKRALVMRSDGEVVFDISMDNNVLYVDTVDKKCSPSILSDLLTAIKIHETTDKSIKDMQSGSLYHFYQRLGHLGYDAIERMAMNSASGIIITDRSRPTCVS